MGRNYRRPWGEIDVISRDKDGTIVFVEVKTLRSSSAADDSLTPEDNLTNAKLKKLRRVCEKFAIENARLINEKKGWRIDLVAVTLREQNSASSSDTDHTVAHYENI